MRPLIPAIAILATFSGALAAQDAPPPADTPPPPETQTDQPPQTEQPQPDQQAPDQQASAEPLTRDAIFIGLDGETLGSATMRASPHGTLFMLDLEGLPADSWVSFHIHETGECTPEDAFESAGSHFALSDTEHGYFAENGPHAGDMPNQHVAADGTLRSEVFNTFVQLSEGGATIDGRALVIHDGPDDYISQPSGDAGDRIACAVIETVN